MSHGDMMQVLVEQLFGLLHMFFCEEQILPRQMLYAWCCVTIQLI